MKTLKEINPDCFAWFKEIPVVKREDLREAAKEWVEAHTDSWPEDLPYDPKAWIKYFFNLEEKP